MKDRKTIFLTGATGHMGQEGLRELLQRENQFEVFVLIQPTPKDRKLIARFSKHPNLHIIWGDLRNYADVYQGVSQADIVLHVGGMVSPLADYFPELTWEVNIGAIRNIIRAIQSLPDPDRVHLVYIGSVAQTGDRNPPLHWGRVGDPINVSRFDHYGITKVAAERELIESGLRNWVSLRQTGIAHSGLFGSLDPIMFHEPINGVLEWVTARDSGRLLAHVCEDDVPGHFWGKVYNIGGGKTCRVVNHQFMQKFMDVIGVRDLRKVFEPNWFALKNFHGQWYEDSDILEDILHFRSECLDDFFAQMSQSAPFYMRFSGYLPSNILKHWIMQPVAVKKNGTLHWIQRKDHDHISAFFGSRERWEQIPNWDHFELAYPSTPPVRLNHGYDERIPDTELALGDVQEAARFRGGECLSKRMETGDLRTPLEWRCAFGHTFRASPYLVLKAGHWCPECGPSPANLEQVAQKNPFLRQVVPVS